MIELPPSKSIGARFLIASFFTGNLPADPIFDDNDDLMVLQQALLEIFSDEEPIDYGDSLIDVGASGTALRFVTALCASCPGADYVITGIPRLMERPMTPLLNLLKDAGADVEALGENMTGPYRVVGKILPGGSFSIPADISSQFISATMLAAPGWEKGVELSFTTPIVSAPYVKMTARVMREFGINVDLSDSNVIVPHAKYKEPENFKVEADWSAASFFYEACALGAQDIKMPGLTAPEISLQGDAVSVELFAKLGVESLFNADGVKIFSTGKLPEQVRVDFTDCPDLFLPFAVASLCCGVRFHASGVRNLRLKESDRIGSLVAEAARLGFEVKAGEDSVEWDGATVTPESNPVIETHNDHRVAMAFAMTALKLGEIKIRNPRVVEKSFINFWNQLPDLGLRCEEAEDVMTVKKL